MYNVCNQISTDRKQRIEVIRAGICYEEELIVQYGERDEVQGYKSPTKLIRAL